MLQEILSIGQVFEKNNNTAVLKMTSHSRMAGSVPVWEKASTAKQQTAQRFAEVLNGTDQQTEPAFKLSLTSDEKTGSVAKANEKPFGFGDLFDMVNPLHHIPVLGSIYRNISGDTIRGPGQVIGGALFGGPLGAAASMINMIVKHDTGQDITDHALNFAFSKETAFQQDAERKLPTEQNKATLNQSILAYEKTASLEETSITTTRL